MTTTLSYDPNTATMQIPGTPEPTVRQALRALREHARTLPAGSYRKLGGMIDLEDGGHLEIGHARASDGGVLLGCYEAARYDRSGELVKVYAI